MNYSQAGEEGASWASRGDASANYRAYFFSKTLYMVVCRFTDCAAYFFMASARMSDAFTTSGAKPGACTTSLLSDRAQLAATLADTFVPVTAALAPSSELWPSFVLIAGVPVVWFSAMRSRSRHDTFPEISDCSLGALGRR
jgi:hypothetical protein